MVDQRDSNSSRSRKRSLYVGDFPLVKRNDLDHFEHVLAMDADNLDELIRLAERSGASAEIRRLRDHDPVADGKRDVPDPYYGGARGFENVHDIVERSCRGLLEDLRSRYGM